MHVAASCDRKVQSCHICSVSATGAFFFFYSSSVLLPSSYIQYMEQRLTRQRPPDVLYYIVRELKQVLLFFYRIVLFVFRNHTSF